mgnify:FL=1
MINTGTEGSLSFFFENKLIASVPLNDNMRYEDWLNVGNDIILDGMRDSKMKFSGIKTAFWKCVHKLKQYENKMCYKDHLFLAQAFLALIKLKQIDPEGDSEGLFVQPLRSTASIQSQ